MSYNRLPDCIQLFKGRRIYYSTAFLLLCSLLLPSISHQQQSPEDYRSVYKQADDYYNLNEPTDRTDSLALSYYNKTIQLVQQNSSLSAVLIDCYIKSGNIFQGKNALTSSDHLFGAVTINMFNKIG